MEINVDIIDIMQATGFTKKELEKLAKELDESK